LVVSDLVIQKESIGLIRAGHRRPCPFLLLIHPISQLTRTFKSHHLSRGQHDILTSIRIPSFTFFCCCPSVTMYHLW